MNSHPYPTKLTNDIHLEGLEVGQSRSFFNFVQRDQPHQEQFDPFVSQFNTLDDVKKIFQDIQDFREQGLSLTCTIWDKTKLIGFMNGGMSEPKGAIRLGYGLDKDYEGRGIISSTAKVILDYAFTHYRVDYAWLTCWTNNTRSIHVAERLGFKRDPKVLPAEPEKGILKEQYRYVLKNPNFY